MCEFLEDTRLILEDTWHEMVNMKNFNNNQPLEKLSFYTINSFITEVSIIYCSANQWTGFCMTGASVMKKLNHKSVFSILSTIHDDVEKVSSYILDWLVNMSLTHPLSMRPLGKYIIKVTQKYYIFVFCCL